MFSFFASSLEKWIEKSIPAECPPGVAAFMFNMSECGDWLVQVVGTSTYDPNDPDWACPPEAWEGRRRDFVVRRSVGGGTWEAAQEYVSRRLRLFIETSPGAQADVLRKAQAVCVGFVDGDVMRVWPAAEA